MLNYVVDPEILTPFLPPGIELDAWRGKALASIVGFEFAEVRVLRIPVPFHRHFEEINLRFYVRRRTADGWRRGVVFVRELVPLPTVALLARRVYGEPYKALPMERLLRRHPVTPASPDAATREHATTVRYSGVTTTPGTAWKQRADTTQDPRLPEPAAKKSSLPITPTDTAPAAGKRSNTSSNTLPGATGTP